jgi:hypothetical protein
MSFQGATIRVPGRVCGERIWGIRYSQFCVLPNTSSLCNYDVWQALTCMHSDFHRPHVHLCNSGIRDQTEVVNPRWQGDVWDRRVHLCNMVGMGLGIAFLLQDAIAFDILWVRLSVFAPVVRIALAPSLLSPHLVVLVVWVGLQFALLPLPSALTLAIGFCAVRLMRDLRTWLKGRAARDAKLVRHEILHTHERVWSVRDEPLCQGECTWDSAFRNAFASSRG